MIFQIKLKLSTSAKCCPIKIFFFRYVASFALRNNMYMYPYNTYIESHICLVHLHIKTSKKKVPSLNSCASQPHFVAMNPLTVSGEVTSSIILGTSIDSFAFIKKGRSPQQAKTKHLIFIVTNDGFTVSPADCDAPILCFNLPRCFIGENGLHGQAYFLRSSPYRPVDNMHQFLMVHLS